ncbi:MAG: sugar ABC transporter permease [Anaerolineae bacterium]|nr:sugar ABC transporter permease [Anaerolineae bacterium]
MAEQVSVLKGGLAARLRLSRRGREEIGGYLFILPWIIGFLAFTVGPMVYSLYLGFVDTDILTHTDWVGLENYKAILTDKLWRKSLVNTAYYTFVMVPLSTSCSLLLAVILNQDVKLLSLWRTIYYLPSVVSGVAVALLWIWILNRDFGVVNGALALFGISGPAWLQSQEWAMPALILMSLWGLGGSMIIFLAALQGVPESLYDAAEIDGAGSLRCFWHITLPMITPTIFFSLVMGIINSFQVFTSAYIMTRGGPNNATLTQVLYLYRKAFEQFHFGYGSAVAWLLFAIILAFTLMVVRSSAFWVYYEGELKK